MNTPQSTISQHLTKLRTQGLIEGDRHGVEIQYRIVSDDIRPLIALLLKEIESDPATGITLNC
jgi:ArsR family transcriptional regulator